VEGTEVKHWVVHGVQWAVLYFAFVENIDGALYALKFFIWVLATTIPYLLTDSAIESAAAMPPAPVMARMNQALRWVTLGSLIWFGHLFTAAAWAFAMLIKAAHRKAVNEARVRQQEPKP
jgi:hypothetical protein